MNLKYFIIILINFSIYGCTLFYGTDDCHKIHDFGKAEMFPRTKKLFDVYKNKTKAIFTDSLGKKDTFLINYDNIFRVNDEPVYEGNCVNTNKFELEVVKIKFTLISNKTFFEIGANYYREEISNLNSKRFDFVSCSSPEGIITASGTYNFEIKNETEQLKKKIIKLLGKDYNTIVPYFVKHIYYFTEEDCLVAIKLPDLGNRLMVLEKLE